MKKILLSAVAMAVMSVSAFADTGTIGKLNFAANGAVWIDLQINGDANVVVSKQLAAATDDTKKALIAAILTAKSTGATVTMWAGTVHGVTGWKNVILK